MTFVNAIPVHCVLPGGAITGGSAVLISFEKKPYLLTSAHAPVGDQPTAMWDDWARSIHLHLSTTTLSLELFRQSPLGVSVPLFGYARPAKGPFLHDTLWLPLEPEHAAVLAADFPSFAIREYFSISGGLTAFGYPTSGTVFPPTPTPSCVGAAVRFNGNVLETTLPVVQGYSGGPVLDSDQQLVGITIGTSGALGQVAPSNAIFRMMHDWAGA